MFARKARLCANTSCRRCIYQMLSYLREIRKKQMEPIRCPAKGKKSSSNIDRVFPQIPEVPAFPSVNINIVKESRSS